MLHKTLLRLFCLSLALAACGRSGIDRFDFGEHEADASPDSDVVDEPDSEPGFCGDGVVDFDEGCDEGAENDDDKPDACRTDCQPASCGDGVLDTLEECDDGNDVDGDACDNTCFFVADDPCSPCEQDTDCARDADLCVSLLDGTFCGLACDGDCPDGFECADVPEGARQCVPELRVCGGCLDRDGDGYGVGRECLGIDCNDDDELIHPGADEFCDGVDTDCNGRLDDDYALDAPIWWADADGDSYGDPDVTTTACRLPEGYVDNDLDCDDANPNINPGADEVCDDIDNNCNDENDEGCPPDLIIDAETVRMHGEFLFDRVEILNGGVLVVTHFDPDEPGTGCIDIEARIVLIRADSGINAGGAGGAGPGRGQDGGFGEGLTNVGPGGGGYGGEGGRGIGVLGGFPYGAAESFEIRQGSDGGDFHVRGLLDGACGDLQGLSSEGGSGGGCVRLEAGAVRVWGYVRANGQPGEPAVDSSEPDIVDGAGGGSGGGIMIASPATTINEGGELTAVGAGGGSGATYAPFGGGGGPDGQCIGNGGGGGAGGRIKLFGRTTLDGDINVRGGRGADGPQSNSTPGEPGTVFIE